MNAIVSNIIDIMMEANEDSEIRAVYTCSEVDGTEDRTIWNNRDVKRAERTDVETGC